MTKQTTSSSGSFCTLLFFVFLFCKLAKVTAIATWSWWWVTAPLWIGAAFGLTIAAVAGIIFLIAYLYEEYQVSVLKKEREKAAKARQKMTTVYTFKK